MTVDQLVKKSLKTAALKREELYSLLKKSLGTLL
jgi:hypothetical protein